MMKEKIKFLKYDGVRACNEIKHRLRDKRILGFFFFLLKDIFDRLKKESSK